MADRNIWLDGMMGLITGDALGNPVQFMSREEIRERGSVCGMEAGGVYETPAGTWTDDSSMAIATLDSVREIGAVVLEDIMMNFVKWECHGEYTPFGEAFDEGNTCTAAIMNFIKKPDWKTCGRTGEYANGNGGLMRILPVCLHLIEQEIAEENITVCIDVSEAVKAVHQVTALTHNHRRAMIACGLYYFMARELVCGAGSLTDRLQKGLETGFAFYRQEIMNLTELTRFQRLSNLSEMALLHENDIKSSGYVIDTLEAAVWCLIRTNSYRECLLMAVNLGDDADTVGAVAGGLAGLYYGYSEIPKEWLQALQKRDWLEELCTWEYRSDIPIVDIHVHILPGIDDGSTDIDMSMDMIRSAYRQGVRGILCTPHADGVIYTDSLKKGWEEIRKRCREQFPDLVLGLGCELYLSPEYLEEELECLRLGSVLSLNGTKYVLVEFLQTGIPFAEMKKCVCALKEAGWIPVIAHAERYGRSYMGIEDIRWLKEHGCKLQINLYSLAADINKERRDLTRKMIKERLVDFLGTDAHRMSHRPPRIANGMKVLKEIADPEYVKEIAYQNVERFLKLLLLSTAR